MTVRNRDRTQVSISDDDRRRRLARAGVDEADRELNEYLDLVEAMNRSPQELMHDAIRVIVDHRRQGTLTADEATSLLQVVIGGGVAAGVNEAVIDSILTPHPHSGRSHRNWRHPGRGHRLTLNGILGLLP